MQNVHDVVVAIVAFIVLIGVMVVVHEFGHFFVAKVCGVRVEAFSIGFGPRLFGIKRGDTDYKVCLLPLDGQRPGCLYLSSAMAAHADRPCRAGGQFHPGLCADGFLLQLD
jgi:Peptidase family M50